MTLRGSITEAVLFERRIVFLSNGASDVLAK
jgi:hypothetical protein